MIPSTLSAEQAAPGASAQGVQPDVSIIIPVHNDADWIASSIESCLAQTAENFEVICVDDASTDSTAEVITD